MARVGTKRADRRWIDPEGQEWASRFEWEVYEHIRSTGRDVRKCGKGDSISYSEPKRGCLCMECGSAEVTQQRIYTPDLYIPSERESGGWYVEVKGYFPGTKRKLFKDMLASRQDTNICMVYERNSRAPKSKLTYLDYTSRYFKIPACAGKGKDLDIMLGEIL